MNMRTDLSEVAQLIESCFASTLDAEGIHFVQYLRKVDESLRRGINTDHAFPNMSGFVWQEKGELIANCSLIPHSHQGRVTYLIANVTVKAEYRQRGIARQLTEAAIRWLKYRHQPAVWLQVREGNDIARHLYQKLGFKEKHHRATWVFEPAAASRVPVSPFIRRRKYSDWQQQENWLDLIYPRDIRWCLGLNARDFTPNLFHAMSNWMDDRQIDHYCVEKNGQLQAICTWCTSSRICPPLWLASDEAHDLDALSHLVPYVVNHLKIDRPIQINYPFTRSASSFTQVGFKLLHSLIWMKLTLANSV